MNDHKPPLLAELMDMGHTDCDICTYSRKLADLGKLIAYHMKESYFHGDDTEHLRAMGRAYLELTKDHAESEMYHGEIHKYAYD